MIIPAFNAGPYLAESISSVLAQDHPDVECVVVNDGSTDATGDVAKSFGGFITYISRENSGCAGPPRNAGIDACTGGYVAFHDADDILLPGALSAQARALDENPDCDMCVSDHANFDASGVSESHFTSCPSLLGTLGGRDAAVLDPFTARSLLLDENYIGCCHAMVRRELLDQGLRFHTRLFGTEDFHFYYRVMMRSSVAILRRTLMHRRLHDSNSTRQASRMLKNHILSRKLLAEMETDPALGTKLGRNIRGAAGMLLWHQSKAGDWGGTLSAMRDTLTGPVSPAALLAAAKALARCLAASARGPGR
ncbi:MAG: glycosyltransferase family 2 protein [Thermodesulfobacteriota bacterium]